MQKDKGQISASQQDIFAKSADLMKKLGLESEWRPSEMKREDSGTWHSLVSPRLQIRFFGSRLQFLSMERIKPAGYIRSGGKMLDEKEVRGIAMKRFSQIRPGNNWFISQCTIGNKWSPPSVQFGYRIYGLTDSARTAWMNIDSADGKVLSLSVWTPRALDT